MTEKYIGLMSGTSLDGIDVALLDFESRVPKLLATHHHVLPDNLRAQLSRFHTPSFDEINQLGKLDRTLGNHFATATLQLLTQANLSAKHIRAIGSHGQTIRHSPDAEHPFTLQIGDPNMIASTTGITTIADFRRRDMALGGQGAPLTPMFHDYIFRHETIDRVILNIGGIANISLLTKNAPIAGYDTGPGNALLDAWCEEHTQKRFDDGGAFAASGRTNSALLNDLLGDAYFHKPPPKSTGREYFNLFWLANYLKAYTLTPEDIQATLLDLTATSIIHAVGHHMTQGEIIVCGGGAHNTHLMQTLQTLSPAFKVSSTAHHGIDPDWIEAMAFAWFAKQALERKSSNSPPVTGASRPAVLGGIYYGSTETETV